MNDSSDARYARGWETLTRVSGTEDPSVVRRMGQLAPDLARFIVEFGYGDCYSRPGLSETERQLITLGSLTAMGGCEQQLAVHVDVALNVGLSPDRIIEALMHALPYVGFPRTLNAVESAQRVFERRGVWTSDEWRAASGGSAE